jgi:hypothetical protein
MSVGYDVTTKADQSTIWEVRWLDRSGKAVKTAKVSYSAELLKSGPEFYRSVFKQLCLADWRHGMGLESRDSVEAYWRGAARIATSRETSLERAWEVLKESDKNPGSPWIPELAGMLAHTPLPGYAEVVSLDRVLLARGAAWLAFAENLSSAKLDVLWAPILFQAGRERAAARIWQAATPAKLEASTFPQEGWNIWLRQPRSPEVFLFATTPTNLPMAMPMLAYEIRVNGTGKTLAELMPQLVDTPEQFWPAKRIDCSNRH